MSKGVRSPWAPREATQADPLIEARAGQTPVAFEGRFYRILIVVPFTHRDEAIPRRYGKLALGEALAELWAEVDTFPDACFKQSINVGARIDGPCVELELPNTTVYGAASATDLNTARKMLIDRLALVLSAARSDPRVESTLKTYAISVSRTQ